MIPGRRSILALAFGLISLPCALASDGIPQCWQDCMNQAGQVNCDALDTACICRAWNGGLLTTAVTCIESTCNDSADTDLFLSLIEVTCQFAGVSISNSAVESALQAATSTAAVTQTQTTLSIIATTIVVPVTDSNSHTLLVAFPVTIEPSTTIYGPPSTSTPLTPTTPSASAGYSFGSCSNPGIIYAYGLDSQPQYVFQPADTGQFPHGASPDIATIESFICTQLRDPCHASAAAQHACAAAFDSYSGLTGQHAADVWNIALGLPVNETTPSAAGAITATAPTETTSTPVSTAKAPTLTTATAATATPTPRSSTSPRPTTTAQGNGSPFETQGKAVQIRPGEAFIALVVGGWLALGVLRS